MDPTHSIGSYIWILTTWNICMLLMSYLFYRHICSDMNFYLKSRRLQNSKHWQATSQRESAVFANLGDVVLLNGAEEDSICSPLVTNNEDSYNYNNEIDV